jgi:hypothetical protein
MSESRIRSVDDLLIATEAVKLGQPVPAVPKQEATEKKLEPQTIEIKESNESEPEPVSLEIPEEKKEGKELVPEEKESDKASKVAQDDVDEYGNNKVTEKKMYSEEEVQRMIRDRLSRGRHVEAAPQPNIEAPRIADDADGENWESQLKDIIKQTNAEIEQEKAQRAWQQQEAQTQSEFEVKFSQSMGKYKDFSEVVTGKPITNSMMMAARSMTDPAAFIYAACKQQPKEIERIAQLNDPIAQTVEIGRLEEKMKKARQITSSPKPASKISGDMVDETPRQSIDQLINQHAKSKIMLNRR